MMDIFENQAEGQMAESRFRAERMRPQRLDDFVGQQKAVGPGTLLRQAIAGDCIFAVG